MRGFIIAGTNSGCGKTTVTIGLMALLKFMGNKVAAFKTGPDYIDPLFHSSVLGTNSYNLDSFMLDSKVVKHLFYMHTQSKDIAIVEGVMGMYDGLGNTFSGSSYELSKILDLPIILVVNCKSLYQSAAAIVKGFAMLKADANVKGVILNHIPSDSNYQFLKLIIERECKVSCIGYLPSNNDFVLKSRHLGLVQAEEVKDLLCKTQKLANTLSKTIDIEKLLHITTIDTVVSESVDLPRLNLTGLHIGIAHDKAFRFYYHDNIELLEKLGAKLYYFSPLESQNIPAECNCLYIGGGYPEVFAQELSENTALIKNIKNSVKKGLPVYAECGGLMYLANEIIDTNNNKSSMVSVFDVSIQMTKKLQRFGYARVEYNGVESKCHEFHHSKVINSNKKTNYTLEYNISKPEKLMSWQCGLKTNNCLAGYAHIHFYSNFDFFEQIVKLWRKKTI